MGVGAMTDRVTRSLVHLLARSPVHTAHHPAICRIRQQPRDLREQLQQPRFLQGCQPAHHVIAKKETEIPTASRHPQCPRRMGGSHFQKNVKIGSIIVLMPGS